MKRAVLAPPNPVLVSDLWKIAGGDRIAGAKSGGACIPRVGRARQPVGLRHYHHLAGGEMAPILTPEDVVRQIAGGYTFVDERGAVGIRLKPAAAIVRRYGEQFRAPRWRQRKPRPL
jgi:hypothetical protein